MHRPRWLGSVVTRLVAALVVGGVLVSVGLSVLELRRSETLLQMELTQQITLTARNLQSVLRGLVGDQPARELRETLAMFASDPRIRAARLVGDRLPGVELGQWADNPPEGLTTWVLPEHGLALGREIDFTHLTLVRAPFASEGQVAEVQLLVDGPAARRGMRERVFSAMAGQWLLMAIMTLLGLLLVRRWFTGPLSDVVDLVGASTEPAAFQQLARQYPGEFGQLADAIGGMLQRLDDTTAALRQREQAFEDLYQFAPAAMLSLDEAGTIVEANRRAAQLLGAATERDLIGQAALGCIHPQDRALLRHSIDRLDLDPVVRCELRLTPGHRAIDALVECTGLRDQDGVLRRVRLSLLDVSQSKQLQRQLADKSRLLNLVIDHMSDAIVLVDAHGRVAAHNQQLAALLHRRPDSLVGQPYDPEQFWQELGVLDQETFVTRLRQIDAEHTRPAQERVETRAGTFLFEGIPVQDAAVTGGSAGSVAAGAAASAPPVGRLWVLQEITPQEQSQRLLNQQAAQLQALRQVAQQLCDVGSVDELLHRVGEHLSAAFAVEAVGIALRCDQHRGRSRQLLHRGPGPYHLAPNRALVEAVERQLMPDVLPSHEVMLWPEVTIAQSWGKAFQQAGLTSVAALALRGRSDAQGILWIARRGSQRLERHHIHLLEALGPIVAARLEFAELRERMVQAKVADPVTDLPNREQFQEAVHKLVNRPGYPWSALTVGVARFKALNDQVGHDVANDVLRQVAAALQRTLRKTSFLARLHGPTFGILCPEMDRARALALAQRLHQAVADLRPALAASCTWELSVCVGLASHPDDGRDGSAIVDLALARLDAAKRRGTSGGASAGASGGDPIIASDPPASRQAG